MKRLIFFSTILFFHLSSYSQEKQNILTPEEFANGWELLFDGETLNGWKAYNGSQPQSWTVKDNAIYCKGTDGGDDLMTIARYSDFDLKFEWKIVENGNSGVIYRTREGKQWSRPYLTGPEYQVYGEKEVYDNHSTGSLYDVFPTSKDKKINPAMNWNTGRIRISNNMVTHWVNGVIVMQCEIHSAEWNEAVANSKWSNKPYFGKSPYGHIDFQNHGSEVWYRNVKILQL